MRAGAWSIGLVGVLVFAYAGLTMVNLQSQAGNTVAEAFYQAMGYFSFGMAALTLVGTVALDRLYALATPAAAPAAAGGDAVVLTEQA